MSRIYSYVLLSEMPILSASSEGVPVPFIRMSESILLNR